MYVYLILVLFILDVSLIKGQDYEDERAAVRHANEQHRNVKVFVDVHKHPKTGFSCEGKKAGEYYADPETLCAVYYICLANQYGKLSATSFACPNGTIFNQANKVCTPHEQVSCDLATRFYDAHRGVVDSAGNDPAQYEPQNNIRPWVPENPPSKPQSRFQPPPQSRPQPQPQPQPQSRPQPQPARPSSSQSSSSRNQPPQPRSQPQSRPQPAPHENAFRPLTQPPQLGRPSQPISLPQPGPSPTTARPGLFKPSILLGARRNSFRPPQFLSSSSAGTTPTTTTTTTSTTTTTQSPLSVEYVYDYVDYDPQGVPSSPPPPSQPLSNQRQKRSASDDKQRRRGPIQPVDYLPPREYTTQLRVSSFTCSDKLPGAVYADVENQCKMFHICLPLSKGKMEDHQLFCGQGLAYNQEKGACEEPTNFNCSKSEDYYMYDKQTNPEGYRKNAWRLNKELKTHTRTA